MVKLPSFLNAINFIVHVTSYYIDNHVCCLSVPIMSLLIQSCRQPFLMYSIIVADTAK